MKFKFLLFLTLGAFLVTLIACSEDSDSSLLDDEPRMTSTRSSQNLSISYEMTTEQIIEPTIGTLEDLCAIDVKMIAVPSTTTTVNTSFSPSGDPCITMNEQASRARGEVKGGKETNGTSTTFCEGVITHTDENGVTTSTQVDIDLSFFQSIAQSFYYTETQKDSAMNVMILDAKNNGAITKINNNALTIIETDADGNTITTLYDMKNHVMIGSQTTDPSGKIIDKTMLTYTCKSDGTMVPNYFVNYNYKDNMICSDPIYTVEQVNFNNFQISL